jgi:hypothetical protein
MRLHVRHRTAYHYDVPIASAVQTYAPCEGPRLHWAAVAFRTGDKLTGRDVAA